MFEEDLASRPLLGWLGDMQLKLVAGTERVEAQHEVHAGQEVAGGVSVQVLLQPPRIVRQINKEKYSLISSDNRIT